MSTERSQEPTALVTGLGLLGISIFAGLSLFSFNGSDVMNYDASAQGHLFNLCGKLGAYAAHHLYCLYGIGSWVLVLGTLVLGAILCASRSMDGMLLRGFGLALAVALLCTWTAPMQAQGTQDFPAGMGGLVGGSYLYPPLLEYFGPVGVYLVLVTCAVLAGMLIAQDLTEMFLAMLGRGCAKLLQSTWHGLVKQLQERAARTANAPQMQPTPAPISVKSVTASATVAPLPRKQVSPPPPVPVHHTPAEQEELAVDPDQSTAAIKFEKEVDEAKRRREEAMRQAEVAEAERQQRLQAEKERMEHEALALEKLEKERRLRQSKQDEAQARFAEAMAEKKGSVEPQQEEPGQELSEEDAELELKKTRLAQYELPNFQSLEEKDIAIEVSSEDLKERGAKLIETLWEFKIGSRLVGITHGPTVTMFELSLDPGIKVSRVAGLSDNLAMAMKAEHGVRIIAPLPGRDTIGIEIPNSEDYVVRMRPILESTAFRAGKWTLPLVLGRDATGNPLVADLAKMPHLLIAGTTGSGKSVCVNSIILSLLLLRRPQEVKLILVDPKQVEMTDFKGIPHLLSPVVTDMKLAAGVLTWAVQKMEDRYTRMSKMGVRNIATYNKLTTEERMQRLPEGEDPEPYADPMPYIVIIVDEFADLMMTAGKEIEQAIARLAQKARAAGIHVILATQRPSADVVTGLIKTNMPSRICFQVKSKVDSRIVLDQGGGEKLAGKGDMLLIPPGSGNPIRAKGVFIADHELLAVVNACKNQAEPIYSDDLEQVALSGDEESGGEHVQELPMDEKFEEAVEVFLSIGRASTSLLQRRMSLGYTRAAKICDQLEARGIVGPDRGAKGRELLITREAWEQYKFGSDNKTWGSSGSKDNPGKLNGNDYLPENISLLDDEDGVMPEGTEGDGGASVNRNLVAKLDTEDEV